MPFTQADLDRIDAELASVNYSTQFGDRTVVKKRADELLKQRAHIAAQIESAAATAAGRSQVKQIRMFGGKGF